MLLECSYTFLGQIGSGKTTIATQLQKILNIPMASFGGYLKNYLQINQDRKDVTRSDLQDLGQYFIEKDSEQFLKDVIRFSADDTGQMIFDGVRHKIILETIKRLSISTRSIFVAASYDVRLNRFISRMDGLAGPRTELEFIRENAHPVESEIVQLAPNCDFILDNSRELALVMNDLRKYLHV